MYLSVKGQLKKPRIIVLEVSEYESKKFPNKRPSANGTMVWGMDREAIATTNTLMAVPKIP